MNTAAALLAAIREHPEDDTPRLAMADLIQEDGDDDRAELIRIQCELARLPKGTKLGHYPDFAKPLKGARYESGFPYECQSRCPLCRHIHCTERERDLLLRHPEWRPVCVPCKNRRNFDLSCPYCHGTGRIGEYRRGWLHRVTVPRLSDVWEQQEQNMGFGHPWIPTAWALTLVREHPLLAEVVCEDRRPADRTAVNGMWYWFKREDLLLEIETQTEDARIPPPVFDELPSYSDHTIALPYPTAPDALTALAVAQVAALRRLSF